MCVCEGGGEHGAVKVGQITPQQAYKQWKGISIPSLPLSKREFETMYIILVALPVSCFHYTAFNNVYTVRNGLRMSNNAEGEKKL